MKEIQLIFRNILNQILYNFLYIRNDSTIFNQIYVENSENIYV